MNYPENLKPGDLIGICAPSAGIEKPEKQLKLDYAIKQLKEMGFNVVETESVRKDVQGRSASKEIRAKEFLDLYLNPDVHAIIFAAGGDFLVEILPYLNLENIEQNPKWFMGYSDPTTLLYLITTKLDIATLYGVNAGSYDQTILHESLKNNIEWMKKEYGGEYPINDDNVE